MNEEDKKLSCKICNKSLYCDFIDKAYCWWLFYSRASKREKGDNGWAVGGDGEPAYEKKRDMENARIQCYPGFFLY